MEKLTSATARVLDVEEPRSSAEQSQSETTNGAPAAAASASAQSRRPRLSMGIRAKQIGNVSAYRSTASSSSGQTTQSSSNGEGQAYLAQVGSSQTDTSDSTDGEVRDRKRRYKRKHGIEKSKSSSLHDLTPDTSGSQEGRVAKSHSQENIIDTTNDVLDPHRTETQHSDAAFEQAPPRQSGQTEYINSAQHQQPDRLRKNRTESKSQPALRSSESENDSFESNTNASHSDDLALASRARENGDPRRIKSESSSSQQLLYKYDSDSDRALREGAVMQRHNAAGRHMARTVSRDENLAGGGAGRAAHTKRQAPLPLAMSESYLNTVRSFLIPVFL